MKDPKIKLWDKDTAHHFNNNIDQSETPQLYNRFYNRFKTDYYKNMLKVVRKTYKRILSKNV